MFRASRVLFGAKKLSNITSKRGNKNFYKGRGAPSVGYKQHNGRFMFDPRRFSFISFVAPDLTGFNLKAYVAKTTPLLDKEGKPTKRQLKPLNPAADIPKVVST